ncbi:IS3 family transposase [Maledivibacter halophilus]|uniref:IS3 family transposase n=1 Tax=Maledivibacter halophilus TaxID=36842 RepID=UPI001483C516|nr:IS3 family transposase [Maledivibacter halophilus]
MLKKLGVSSSGYYSFKKRVISNQKLRKQSLLTEITDIYNESHQIYGAPKITAVLRSRGHIVSEKTCG